MNIRISAISWKGKLPHNMDGSFEQFDTVENGIRAGAKILCNYYRLYGLQTIAQIISRWAPSTENDASSYISNVCRELGVEPNDVIDILSSDILAKLISAIIRQENGNQPYEQALIEAACVSVI